MPLPDSDGDGIPDFQDASSGIANSADGCALAAGAPVATPLCFLVPAALLVLRRRMRRRSFPGGKAERTARIRFEGKDATDD